MQTMNSWRKKNRLIVEKLESRTLYSADPFAAILDSSVDSYHHINLLDVSALQANTNPIPQPSQTLYDGNIEVLDSHKAIHLETLTNTESTEEPSLELVFIDKSTPDYQKFVNDLSFDNESNDRHLKIFTIDSYVDGVSYIGEMLSLFHNVDAVHIVSHGSTEGVSLGSMVLNDSYLLANENAIAAWAESLNSEADLLFYGCEIAKTPEGLAFINNLSELTNSQVAASDDLTGHAILGGDWELEYTTGDVETDPVFSQTLVDDYASTLAVITGTPGHDMIEGTSGDDTLNGEGGNDIILGGRDVFNVGHSDDVKNFGSKTSEYNVSGTNSGWLVSAGTVDFLAIDSGLSVPFEVRDGVMSFNSRAVDLKDSEVSTTLNSLVPGKGYSLAFFMGADGETSQTVGITIRDTETIAAFHRFDVNMPSGNTLETMHWQPQVFSFIATDSILDLNLSSYSGDVTGGPLIATMRLISFDDDHGDDIFSGNLGTDILIAGSGNDEMNDLFGNASVMAGNGDNDVYTGDGDDLIITGRGNDEIYSTNGENRIYVEGGNNIISVGAGNDSVTSGSGNDTIQTAEGNDVINAGDGNNIIGVVSGTNTITTGSGNDFIVGGTGVDTINAGDGDNTVTSAAGNDDITTGSGIDEIDAGSGNNSINTGSSADKITVEHGDNFINSDNGNDEITAGDGNNEIYGGNGGDSIVVGGGDNEIYAGDGDDSITAGDGDNEIYADDEDVGHDVITVGHGHNEIYGGNGDDSITAGNGGNEIYGDDEEGVGNDVITVGDGLNEIYAVGGDDVITTGIGDNEIYAGDGDDTVSLMDGDNSVSGGNGSDTISAGSGNNVLYGNGGDDSILVGNGVNIIYGGIDNDIISTGDGNNTIDGGDGDDHITAGAGNNTIHGNAGEDIITTGHGNNRVYGNGGDDHITTGNGDDYIEANEGDDIIHAGNGNNQLFGNAGLNTLMSGDGNDTIAGGVNVDHIYSSGGSNLLSGNEGNDRIEIAAGYSTINGNDGNDTIITDQGNHEIYGNAGDDVIQAGNGFNTIFGNAGNDTISTVDGDNDIYGGDGQDTIIAGAGDDIIEGGLGQDNIYAGAGDDHIGSPFEDDGAVDFLDGQEGADSYNILPLNTVDIIRDSGSEGFDILIANSGVETTFFLSNTFSSAESGIDEILIDTADSESAPTLLQFILAPENPNEPIIWDFSDTTVNDVNTIQGTAYDDEVFLSQNQESSNEGLNIIGGEGDDVLYGGQSTQHIVAGAGDDEVSGGAGNQHLHGGDGKDYAIYDERLGNYVIDRSNYIADNDQRFITVREQNINDIDEGTDTVYESIEILSFSDSQYYVEDGFIEPFVSPVLDNTGTMLLSPINEDAVNNPGQTIESIVASAGGDRIQGVAGLPEGIAIFQTDTGNGAWEYSLNGGLAWSSIGAVSQSSALLLRGTDLVRFAPNAQTGTSASFTFYAWDQTVSEPGARISVESTGDVSAFSLESETAEIQVSDVNDSPTIVTPVSEQNFTLQLDENSQLDFSIEAIDIDSSIEYGLAEGGDNNAFDIDAATGSIRFISLPNYENPSDENKDNNYELQAIAQDSEGVTDSLAITLSVIDINESPTDITLPILSMEHGLDTSDGYSLGRLSTIDEDGTESFAYSIRPGDDSKYFTLTESSSPELQFRDGVLDHEAQSSYKVTIQSSDKAGLTVEKQFEFQILPPPQTALPVDETTPDLSEIVAPLNRQSEASLSVLNSESTNTTAVSESILTVSKRTAETNSTGSFGVSESQTAERSAADETSDEETEGEAILNADGRGKTKTAEESIADSEESSSTDNTTSKDGSVSFDDVFDASANNTVDIKFETRKTLATAGKQTTVTETVILMNQLESLSPAPLSLLTIRNLNLGETTANDLLSIDPIPVLETKTFNDELQALTQQLNDSVNEQEQSYELITEITSEVTVSLTAAVFGWMLKSSSVIASLLSALPIWKQLDPLPILTHGKQVVTVTDLEDNQTEQRVSRMFNS